MPQSVLAHERCRPVLDPRQHHLAHLAIPIHPPAREVLQIVRHVPPGYLDEEGVAPVLDTDVEDGQREELNVWIVVVEAAQEGLGRCGGGDCGRADPVG